MFKTIVLCADDFGQNVFISQGILALLEQGRLSATSCMTNGAAWQECASLLTPFKNKADIGLHFNLTEGQLLTSDMQTMSLGKLIMRAYGRLLDAEKIAAELNAQLDAFNAAMGQLPDFIDGHQHIHQLPVIREVIFKVYEERLRHSNSYIRCVYDDRLFLQKPNLKKWAIQLLGARRFKHELVQRSIPHNSGFSGIYSFHKATHYAEIFPHFLQHITDGGIIMCHPGLMADTMNDVIAAARAQEFHYFISEAFLRDCAMLQIKITPFRN